jgi:zinc protease
MKKISLLSLLCIAVAVSAAAQAPAPSPAGAPPAGQAAAVPPVPVALPTADEILQHYAQAAGGAAAWDKLTSRTSVGTMEFQGMGTSAPVLVYEKAPNKSFYAISVPGFGDLQQAFDGTTGWSSDPQNGVREMSAEEASDAKRDSDFYSPVRLKNAYAHFTVKSKEKVSDKDAYAVEATPAQGDPQTFYFDVASGLLVRRTGSAATPQGKIPSEEFLEDYKEIDGIELPFTVRQTSPQPFVLHLTEVHHNVPIDDAKFAKPAAKK